MTFGLVMSDWIDEYEIFKIAPGPIEIDSKIFVTDWTIHHKWYKAGTHGSESVDLRTKLSLSKWTKLSVDPWYKEQSYIYGHRHSVSGARDALSILEPGYKGGCKDSIRATVDESIRGHSERSNKILECQVAANAGFFNMKTGECMGKV